MKQKQKAKFCGTVITLVFGLAVLATVFVLPRISAHAAAPPNFTLKLNPPTRTVNPGEKAVYGLLVDCLGDTNNVPTVTNFRFSYPRSLSDKSIYLDRVLKRSNVCTDAANEVTISTASNTPPGNHAIDISADSDLNGNGTIEPQEIRYARTNLTVKGLVVTLSPTGLVAEGPPLSTPLRADVSGTGVSGSITYIFNCGNGQAEFTFGPTAATIGAPNTICNYTESGTYKPSVKVTRGGIFKTVQETVVVGSRYVPPTGPCPSQIPLNQYVGCVYSGLLNLPPNNYMGSFTETGNRIFHGWGDTGGPLGPGKQRLPPLYVENETGNPYNYFSVVWRGVFDFDNSLYLFKVLSDDGIRVYLDPGTRAEQIIFDRWRPQGTCAEFDDGVGCVARIAPTIKAIQLAAGRHNVLVEYFENAGEAYMDFWWEKVSTDSAGNESFCDGTTAKTKISWAPHEPSLFDLLGLTTTHYKIDIDDDFDWGNGFWTKSVRGARSSETVAPEGFKNSQGAGMPALETGKVYLVRVVYNPMFGAEEMMRNNAVFTGKDCGASPQVVKNFTLSLLPATKILNVGQSAEYGLAIACSRADVPQVKNFRLSDPGAMAAKQISITIAKHSNTCTDAANTLTLQTTRDTPPGIHTIDVSADSDLNGNGTIQPDEIRTARTSLTVNRSTAAPKPPTGACATNSESTCPINQ